MAAKPKSKKNAGIIAERERDVLALRESEERLRIAQQVAHIGTFEWNIQTGVNRWTPELEAMYGLQPGSFPGTEEAWEQLVHPDDRPEAVRRVNEAMAKGGFEGEWRVVWPDGTVRWLYGRSFVFKDESGKPLKLIGVNIDITERKCMEEELLRSRDELDERVKEKTGELLKTKEELAQRVAERTGELRAAHQSLVEKSKYLDAFFNHTITPLVLLDRDFNFIRVNEAYARACQKDVGEFPGHNHFEFYPSDARVIFEDVIRTRQPVLVNARPFVFPDHPELGVTYWNWTLTPLLDDRGEVEALVFALEDVTERKQAGIELEKHRDQLQELVRERTCDLENANEQLRNEITERKRTEKALRESEERFSAFMDNNPAVSWMKDEQGVYVFLNKACGEHIGIGLDDWLWKTDHELFPRDVADRLRENDREVLASGSMISVEEETVSPDGHRIQWLSVKFPFKDALGNRYVGGIAVDISEHKRAEEALHESEEKFRQLAENIYSVFWISEINVTTGMRYAYMSPAFEHIFGIPVERIYQDPRLWLEMIHPDDKEHFMAAMNKRISGDYYNVNVPDFRIVRPDGTIRWIKARLYPVMGADGTVHRFAGIADDVTERKRAEETLRESEEKFRLLAETSPAAIMIYQDRKYVYANPAVQSITGYSRDELMEMSPLDVIHRDYREKIGELASSRERDIMCPSHNEVKIVTKDGQERWMDSSSTSITYDNRPAGLVVAFDITGRKRAEEALRESEERFKAIFDRAAVGIAISNPDSFMVDSNQTFQEMLGYSKEELRQRRFYDITYPEDIDNNRQLHNQLVAGAIDKYQIEKRYIRKDGQNIWVKLTASAIRDADGKFKYNLAAFEDITERKRAEEALRESETKFRALFEGAGAAIFVADVATGEIIDCNRKAEELTGRSKEEIVGLHQTQLHPADKVKVQIDQFKHHARGVGINNEAEVQHQDGRVIPVMINAAPLKVNGREIMIGFFLDITERKRAEEALRESEKKFRVLADTSKAAIYVYQDEKLVYVNDAAEKITGYSKAELLNMRYWDIVRPDFRELVRQRGSARQRGEPVPSPYEVPFITKGGEARWVELSAGPITFMGMPAAVATFFDITERKQAEEELKAAKAQAELYLDLMGHDINNMHQIALGYLELALSMPADARPDEMLEKPIEVLQRSAQLIKNVRKLQKLKEGVFQGQEIDVCNVLIDVQREMGAVPHKAIVLNMNGCECCHVRANELLHDVFANLVSNAIKHTGERADIVVDLDVMKDNGGQSCRVSVEDNGPGIPDDFKSKVFNRMLKGTDKAKGIGLGLYLVKSLVESYGGRVWVEDRVPGDHTKGARFVVMLPTINKRSS
jgi:PAS domain S-box-containing protein